MSCVASMLLKLIILNFIFDFSDLFVYLFMLIVISLVVVIFV